MIRRAMTLGIIGGWLVVLGALYPVLAVFIPTLVAGWEPPAVTPVAHAVLLMLSAITVLGASLITPVFAARTHARGFGARLRYGSIAGLFMGLIVCLSLALPINNLSGWQMMRPFFEPLAEPRPVSLLNYTLRMVNGGALAIVAAVVIYTALGAIAAGVYGVRRAKQVADSPRPTLYELARHNRVGRWFETQDGAASVALAVGLAVGIVLTLIDLQSFYIAFERQWPELPTLLAQELAGVITLRFGLLSPLAAVVMPLMGIVAVALIQNPTERYWQRVGAVATSMNIVALFWLMQVSRSANFYLGVTPILIARAPAGDLAGFPANVLPLLPDMTLPASQVAVAFLSPPVLLVILGLAVSTAGLLLGMIYAALIPAVLPRPVDHAGRLKKRLGREPGQTLPQVYQLLNRNASAYEILAHLCIGLGRRQRELARLIAAYHTLGTTDPYGATVDRSELSGEVATLLEKHPEWRHAREIGSVHRTLCQILSANSLEAVLEIAPPFDSTTTSVPPLIVQAIERIKSIVEELQKFNRVDDLQSRLTFLNDALDALNVAQRFVNHDMRDRRQVAAPYPEQPTLAVALERWSQMVIATTRRLKGRADVVASLKSNRVPHATRIPINFVLQNRGLNVAENIRLKVQAANDYYIVPPGETAFDILPAGESHQLTLFVDPKPDAKRLRVEWEVAFDDSVETLRSHKSADVVEFVQPEKPFQRIFPIPYVTGTPLKDGTVFVGRQDIFEFVKENLIGATQNNVIILHGQRRTGKTSVLYRLGQVLKDTHIAVLIDMQGNPARGEADFLFTVADDIIYALEQQGVESLLPSKKDFEESPEFFFRSRFLRSLYPLLGKRNLLLLFDEFEELQRRIEDGKLNVGIFHFLRNLMQHEDKLDFIFAGTHKLEELGSDSWSVLFNTAIYKRVTFLAPSEIRRLIVEPVAHYNIEYDPIAVDAITAFTAGHPYFAQILLHELIVYHNETQRGYITAADVEQAVERVLERGEAHFKYIWTESTPEEQKVMRMLAEALIGKTEINAMDLQRFCEESGTTFGSPEIEALTSLAGRDIVTRSGKLYRFTVPLVERWVHRTHPVMA